MAYIRKVFTGFVLVLPLIFSSLISSESSDYNMPIGVTEVSESIFGLHMLIFWICLCFFCHACNNLFAPCPLPSICLAAWAKVELAILAQQK